MKNLKFKGKFKDLKNQGFKFQKLYANNYKVYRKKITSTISIWVWVHLGGYVELGDFYANTKNILEGLKSIEWKEVKEQGKTFRYVRVAHDDPTRGYRVTPQSLTHDRILEYDEFGEYVSGLIEDNRVFDRCFTVTEDTCNLIIEELEKVT